MIDVAFLLWTIIGFVLIMYNSFELTLLYDNKEFDKLYKTLVKYGPIGWIILIGVHFNIIQDNL